MSGHRHCPGGAGYPAAGVCEEHVAEATGDLLPGPGHPEVPFRPVAGERGVADGGRPDTTESVPDGLTVCWGRDARSDSRLGTALDRVLLQMLSAINADELPCHSRAGQEKAEGCENILKIAPPFKEGSASQARKIFGCLP